MENRNRNSDMEDLILTAKAEYNKFTPKEKESVQKWFESMDRDGNGEISRGEFNDFFTQETGIKPIMFDLFDRNGDGKLQFEEAIALFFCCKFSKSQRKGRPTCNGFGSLDLLMKVLEIFGSVAVSAALEQIIRGLLGC